MVDLLKTPGYRAVVKTLQDESMPHRDTLFLSFYSTLYLIPPEISRWKHLKNLRLNGCPIRDLSPIVDLTRLEYINLDKTLINDLSPLAKMTSMMDAVVHSSPYKGLSYHETPVSEIPPFDSFVELQEPFRTVETINEIRRQRGLPSYIPDGYRGLAELTLVSKQNANETEDSEPLAQKPASHSFSLRGGRLEAQAQIISARHHDVADDVRAEVSRKAIEALSRLASCNAPRRLISTVDRLGESLGSSLEDVRAGVLQMRFRSLEADVAAYDTEDGRKELPEDAFAILRDLTSSVEDLMGCFPQLADIEAERLAQRIKEVDVSAIVQSLSEMRIVAEGSSAVAQSALEALRAGEPELAHAAEIIDDVTSAASRVAAIGARDRIVGYMILVYRNFVAGAVKAGNEVAGLSEDVWKEIRKDAPQQLSNAAIASAIALLVSALLGPTAAVGAFAASFKPLRDRAKRAADSLSALVKKREKEG